ncbi:hypothetical protein PV963_34685 [Streptomyces coeruleorubidus]|uniref:hypothetical protein n=1 Tax=Streptomyces coeruleorubidus TaxID=116188 RepID=UPI00237F6A15|nr:hypothetical protein [Streptomyces coeruleorubidus]WDV55140.1 hypothetical protein PV963_34685 [Streptomyces coeruleorubidus]
MSGTPGSLRTRLLVRIGAVLVAVCAATALAGVLAQRAYLLDRLGGRVRDAAEHGLAHASLRPDDDRDLAFPDGTGHPDGQLAARLDAHGGHAGVRSQPGHTEFTVDLPPARPTEGEPPSRAGAPGLSERR